MAPPHFRACPDGRLPPSVSPFIIPLACQHPSRLCHRRREVDARAAAQLTSEVARVRQVSSYTVILLDYYTTLLIQYYATSLLLYYSSLLLTSEAARVKQAELSTVRSEEAAKSLYYYTTTLLLYYTILDYTILLLYCTTQAELSIIRSEEAAKSRAEVERVVRQQQVIAMRYYVMCYV